MSNRIVEMNVTVPTGASGASEAVDLREYRILGIRTPSNWVTSNITFQSSDAVAGTYVDIVNATPAALTLTAIPASRHVTMPDLFGGRIGSFIKILSTTTQTANKTVGLVLEAI